MGVYNDATRVERAARSILNQTTRDVELIAVNDGSTDGSAAVLDRLARGDPRMRVIHQENAGLTRALIRGCEQARGEFVARQDSGDYSEPERLSRQCAALEASGSTVLTACGAVYVDGGGKELFRVLRSGMDLHQCLDNLDVKHIKGPPHHGACMFRRSAYESVGGYRLPFVVAQDIDLWLRLSEVGTCIGTEEFDYIASMEKPGISAYRGELQKALMDVAIRCAQERRVGNLELALQGVVEEAQAAIERPAGSVRKSAAAHHYFLGSCTALDSRQAARKHYIRAIKAWPLHFRSWAKLLGTLL